MLLGSLLLLAHMLSESRSAEEIRGTMFLQLVLGNIGLIAADLSEGSLAMIRRFLGKRVNAMTLALVIIAIASIFYSSSLSNLFEVSRPAFPHLLLAIGSAVTTTLLVAAWNRRTKKEVPK